MKKKYIEIIKIRIIRIMRIIRIKMDLDQHM